MLDVHFTLVHYTYLIFTVFVAYNIAWYSLFFHNIKTIVYLEFVFVSVFQFQQFNLCLMFFFY